MKKIIFYTLIAIACLWSIKVLAYSETEMKAYADSIKPLNDRISQNCTEEEINNYVPRLESCWLVDKFCKNYSNSDCLADSNTKCPEQCLFERMKSCDYLFDVFLQSCAKKNNKTLDQEIADIKIITDRKPKECNLSNGDYNFVVFQTPQKEQTNKTLLVNPGDTIIMPPGRWKAYLKGEGFAFIIRSNSEITIPCIQSTNFTINLGSVSNGFNTFIIPTTNNQDQQYELTTNSSLLTSKGAQFIINSTESLDKIYVLDGTVTVQNLKNQEETINVNLGAGQWVASDSNGISTITNILAQDFILEYPIISTEQPNVSLEAKSTIAALKLNDSSFTTQGTANTNSINLNFQKNWPYILFGLIAFIIFIIIIFFLKKKKPINL